MVIFVIQVTVDNLLLPPQNSLMAALSRWILTNHVLFTCHFRSAISLCKLFPCRCKGWVVFFHIVLKWYLHSLFPYLRRIAIEDIKKVFTQGPYGVRQAYWVCRSWQRVEVPIILRLPMMSRMIKVVAMMLLRLRMTVRMAMIMPIILRLRFYYHDGEDRWRLYWD